MERSKTILVVDDDVVCLTATVNALKKKYRVAAAKSGERALQYLGENTCDLILLDYEMPEMDGSTVLRKLRSVSATADIPVIFLTGNSDQKTVLRLLSLKPDGYLVKPVEEEELLKRVSGIIG